MKKRVLILLLAFLLIPLFAYSETNFTPFDLSCNILIEYLKITMNPSVTDHMIDLEDGIYIQTEDSNIVILHDNDPVDPMVLAVDISADLSKYDHPANCAAGLTRDAVSVYRALTRCKSNDIRAIYDAFLSLGIIESTAYEKNAETVYTVYEDSIFGFDANYETGDIGYMIIKKPTI